jgi:hypothetical protein
VRKPLIPLVDDDRAVLDALEAALTPSFGDIARLSSRDTSAVRTLIATMRPRTVSSAFQTTPIPPSPIFSSSR